MSVCSYSKHAAVFFWYRVRKVVQEETELQWCSPTQVRQVLIGRKGVAVTSTTTADYEKC